MNMFEQAFRTLPDTVIITDVYWYIIDFNREGPFGRLKKGRNLTNYMPDCQEQPRDRYACGGRVYKRSVSPVHEGGVPAGYVVYLADITEKERLTELRRKKNEELQSQFADPADAPFVRLEFEQGGKEYVVERFPRYYPVKKRGKTIERVKNAKPGTLPKSCTPQEYHLATGLECLFGYLYLEKRTERLEELFELCLATVKDAEKEK